MEISTSKDLCFVLSFVDHFNTLRPCFAVFPHLLGFKIALSKMFFEEFVTSTLGVVSNYNYYKGIKLIKL